MPAQLQSAPWDSPAWLEDTLPIVDFALESSGLKRTARPDFFRRSAISAILNVQTTDAIVWFKAVPPIFAHEGRITRWVAGIRPGMAPQVLANGDGWMLTADMPSDTPGAEDHALAELARLQIATIERTKELLAVGCPDRRLENLLADMERLAKRIDLLGPREIGALRDCLPAFAAMCGDPRLLAVPATLVHGDLHAENSRWTGSRWMLFDWTDACPAHPFCDLAQPLKGLTEREAAAAVASYEQVWSARLGVDTVRAALPFARVISTAHQAESLRRIADGAALKEAGPKGVRFWVEQFTSSVLSLSEASPSQPVSVESLVPSSPLPGHVTGQVLTKKAESRT